MTRSMQELYQHHHLEFESWFTKTMLMSNDGFSLLSSNPNGLYDDQTVNGSWYAWLHLTGKANHNIAQRKTISFLLKEDGGHSVKETWVKTDLHCPSCGQTNVWKEAGEGDYYTGVSHMCADCGSDYHQPNLQKLDTTDKEQVQRFAQLSLQSKTL